MDKTIKQLADELKVSKTAVRKVIEKLGLHTSLRKEKNVFLLNENQQKQVIEHFSRTRTETKEETKTETQTETLHELVSMLQKELDAKNEQIATLQKLVSQEQQLRMVVETKLLQIDQKSDSTSKRWWKKWTQKNS